MRALARTLLSAWVLWTAQLTALPNGQYRVDSRWEPHSAYDTAVECRTMSMTVLGAERVSGTEKYLVHTFTDQSLYSPERLLTVKCLPDTVKP
jgi:hypothetical protein